MIDKLRAMAIFSTVIEQGTFRAAARHLGLVPSRVSETVSALERDLGVTLLYRSTRQLSLTHEGRVLHETAQAMLNTVERGLDAIRPWSQDPHGTLRVTAPAFITHTDLIDTFSDFARAYPKVELQFDFSDSPRDLIRDGFDVGIRAGWLENSDLMTRNIGTAERILVARADYVEEMGKPTHPSDLEAWSWVRFSIRPDQTELIGPDGKVVAVRGTSNVTVNSASALYEFAARGLGVAGIPATLASRSFTQSDLVHVLPDWRLRTLGFHAVWPDQSRRETLTLLFVRFLAEARTGEVRSRQRTATSG
ncbi:MAG: LysR family transcriptional regulator [Pseudomonadota bacterium]